MKVFPFSFSWVHLTTSHLMWSLPSGLSDHGLQAFHLESIFHSRQINSSLKRCFVELQVVRCIENEGCLWFASPDVPWDIFKISPLGVQLTEFIMWLQDLLGTFSCCSQIRYLRLDSRLRHSNCMTALVLHTAWWTRSLTAHLRVL